jgi:hypothetical protein
VIGDRYVRAFAHFNAGGAHFSPYVGENLLLLLEGQFTKLFEHLLFDSHPQPRLDRHYNIVRKTGFA